MMRVLSFIQATVLVALCLPSHGLAWSEQAGSINGLWRLAGVMPAGVPSEEVPKGMNDRYFYWFQNNGTVVLVIESGDRREQRKGAWKQDGNEVMIVWETGVRSLVRVVKLGDKHMILTGLTIFLRRWESRTSWKLCNT